MAQRRTDLAVEAHQLWREGAQAGAALTGVRAEEGVREGFAVNTVTISSPEGARALGKPQGVYVTVELDGLLRREEGGFARAVSAVSECLRPLLPQHGPALVIGLGNRAVTPDLIGPLAVDHLLVTRHLVEQVPEHFGDLRPVAAAAQKEHFPVIPKGQALFVLVQIHPVDIRGVFQGQHIGAVLIQL